MLCQKCGLTEAVVHRTSMVFRQPLEEHLCVICAGGVENPAVLESFLAEARAAHEHLQELPWRPAGEFVRDEQTIPFDQAGLAVFSNVVAKLVEPCPRDRSMTLRLADFHVSFLPLARETGPVIGLMFNSLALKTAPDVSERAGTFFRSRGGKPPLQIAGANYAWICHLPREVTPVRDAGWALLSDVISPPPGTEMTVRLEEYFPAPT